MGAQFWAFDFGVFSFWPFGRFLLSDWFAGCLFSRENRQCLISWQLLLNQKQHLNLFFQGNKQTELILASQRRFFFEMKGLLRCFTHSSPSLLAFFPTIYC